jgi:hypothetical protein
VGGAQFESLPGRKAIPGYAVVSLSLHKRTLGQCLKLNHESFLLCYLQSIIFEPFVAYNLQLVIASLNKLTPWI